MTRQKMYGLVVLVLVITLNGAFPARLIGKWSAIAKASSEQNRQLQLELVGEAEMQRNTPIRLHWQLDQGSLLDVCAPADRGTKESDHGAQPLG